MADMATDMKNRNKQNKNKQNKSKHTEESSAPSNQDDVAKKIPKTSSNGVGASAPQGSGKGSSLKLLLAALCYIVLVAAAGFAAFYLQQVLEEANQISAKCQESGRRTAELALKVENVVQQVTSVSSSVDGLESALGTTRAELDAAVRAVRKGDAETRRVDDALQRLQNELLRDLSDGIREVKEACERDFSSLEKTVDTRLAELSRSIAASVAEFTETQGEAQNQLAELKATLGGMEDPALVKQELAAIVDVVAKLGDARDAAEATADSLREQIGSVRNELQTRNQEVASLSQEVEAVRLLVQETAGSLRQSVTGAEAGVQAVTDLAQNLQGGLEQANGALQSLEKELQVEVSRIEKRSDDLEGRLAVTEDSDVSLVASVADLATKLEVLLSKYDSQESALAAQGKAMEQALQDEAEALKASLAELQASLAALSGSQSELASADSSLVQQMVGLEEKLAAQPPEEMEKLRATVDGLVEKAGKLEKHEEAIAALQGVLQTTISSLEELAKTPKAVKEEVSKPPKTVEKEVSKPPKSVGEKLKVVSKI